MLKHKPKIGIIFVWLAAIQFILSSTVFAAGLPQSELNALYTYPNYVQNSAACLNGTPSSSTTASPSQSQNANAQTIIGVAKTDNLGQAGAIIGIMVGLDESGLKIYSNSNVAVSLNNPASQAVGNNGDSVGIFQQQPQYGWSTIATGPAALSNQAAVWQDMDPAFSAEAFFGSPPGATFPVGTSNPSALTKGLQNVSGWQSLQPWIAAQKVQGSATLDGSNYEAQYSAAQSLVNQLYGSSAAVPLPVSVTGGTASAGSSATGTSGCYKGTTGSAGDANSNAQTQAVIQAGLAEIAKGIPYSFGGGGPSGPSTGICDPARCPNNVVGFDCSSFMQYVFFQGAQMNIPRTTQDQYDQTVGAGHTVASVANIQPGDLMFFGSSPSNITHVNMFVGNNMIIEAPETGMNLHEIPMYNSAGPGESLQGIGYFPPIGQSNG